MHVGSTIPMACRARLWGLGGARPCNVVCWGLNQAVGIMAMILMADMENSPASIIRYPPFSPGAVSFRMDK